MMRMTGEERDMAHQRLRTLNARGLHPGSQTDVDMARVVRAGRPVFLSSVTGLDLAGTMVGVGDPPAQAEQAMRTAKLLLKGVFPCGTGIIVSGLPLPEMLVQLDLAAVVPD